MGMMRLINMHQLQAFQQLFARSGAMKVGGAEAVPPEGSWVCSGCKNVNWPMRTSCNNKKCGLAREYADDGPPCPKADKAPDGSWICSMCSNINWPLRSSCNNKKCGLPREQVDGGAPPNAGKGGSKGHSAGAGGGDPDGSWSCPTCGNVNWPLRSACNKKGCSTPRPF